MTLVEPRTLAIYLVEAHKYGSLGARAQRLASISVEASPIDLALHASHNYVYVLSHRGRVEVKQLRASGDAARGGLVAMPSLELDAVLTPFLSCRKLVCVWPISKVIFK